MVVRNFSRSLFAALGLAFAAVPSALLAQSSICADPTTFCQKQLSPGCLERIGAGSIAADASLGCDAELDAYRDCLGLVASQCDAAADPTTGTRGAGDAATMTAIWGEVKDSGDVAALRSFAETYPGTPLAALAISRAAALEGAAAGGNPMRAAACVETVAALQPFLENATAEQRALVAGGDPDGRYSIALFYYQTNPGTAAFDRAHGPRLDRWRDASVAFRATMPAERLAALDYFDQVMIRDIPDRDYRTQAEMIGWLRVLEERGAALMDVCRAASE